MSRSRRGDEDADASPSGKRTRPEAKKEEVAISPEPGSNDNQDLSDKNEPPGVINKVVKHNVASNNQARRDNGRQQAQGVLRSRSPQAAGAAAAGVDADANPEENEFPYEEGLKDELDAKTATDVAQEVDAFAIKVGEEARGDEDEEERVLHESKSDNFATINEEILARALSNDGEDGKADGDGRDDGGGAGRSRDDGTNGDEEGSREAEEDRTVSDDGSGGTPRAPFPPLPHAPHWPAGYYHYPPHYPPHPHYGPYPPLPPGYYPPPPGYFPTSGHPQHPALHAAPPGERDPSTGNFIYGGPPPVAPLAKRSRMRIKTPQDIVNRKIRKNAQSRQRAARLRERVASIKAKDEGIKTEEDERLHNTFEERRVRKNHRSRERALEKKRELDRITSKPESERTEEEVETLGMAMAAKRRKNEGDRLRRERLKKMGLKQKPPGMSICGRPRRPPSGEGSIPYSMPMAPPMEAGGPLAPPHTMPPPPPPPGIHQYPSPSMPLHAYPPPPHRYYDSPPLDDDGGVQAGAECNEPNGVSGSVERDVSELLLQDPEEEVGVKTEVFVQGSVGTIKI